MITSLSSCNSSQYLSKQYLLIITYNSIILLFVYINNIENIIRILDHTYSVYYSIVLL